MFLDSEDVRGAFLRDEFFPLFQPQVDLKTGRLAGFEVLARWNHARLGVIAPDSFIPFVQRHGFINSLTQRLLSRIFAAVPLVPNPLRLSINISSIQLLDASFPARVAEAAERGSFPLDRLTIEITESALLDDLPLAQLVAKELKSLHCRLCLEDFGTHHSRFFHLRDIPFDELKVDRSFIEALTENPASRTIVAALVSLGASLNLVTVAEGIETEDQALIMIELGCNLAQGWLFGRPVEASDIPAIVSATGVISAQL
jgi:EAL domain-containing protein (putative c-di-GMP-specific phosphodiesterase class I)